MTGETDRPSNPDPDGRQVLEPSIADLLDLTAMIDRHGTLADQLAEVLHRIETQTDDSASANTLLNGASFLANRLTALRRNLCFDALKGFADL